MQFKTQNRTESPIFFFQNKMHCLKRVITFCGEKVKTQGVGEKVES